MHSLQLTYSPHARVCVCVCVCVLQHNNLSVDALAVAHGSGQPSPQLIEVWQRAQEIREWLNLGEHANAAVEGADDGVSATWEVQHARLCEEVIRRGKLLLDCNVAALASKVARTHWSKLKSFARKITSAAKPNLFELVKGAKAANELRELLNYQRSVAQADSKEQSTSDAVIGFVKDAVSAAFMRRVLSERTTVASYRAEGLRHLVEGLQGVTAPSEKINALAPFYRALRSYPERCHPLSGLEGCDAAVKAEIRSYLEQLLTQGVELVRQGLGSRDSEGHASVTCGTLESTLVPEWMPFL